MPKHKHVHVHYHEHGGGEIRDKLDLILAKLTKEDEVMSAHSDALAALESIAQKLEGDLGLSIAEKQSLQSQKDDLAAQLAAAKAEDDTEAIQALSTQLQALDAQLAPAPAPAPAPEPVPATPAATNPDGTAVVTTDQPPPTA